jgi:hypothetical protein
MSLEAVPKQLDSDLAANLIDDDAKTLASYFTSFPTVAQSSVQSNGLTTEILIQLTVDQVFISITQIGKIGTLLTGNFETMMADNSKQYEVDIVLGRRDDPLMNVYCRQLIEKSLTVDPLQRPVLLSIALKEEGRDSATFQAVLNETLRLFAGLL